MSGPTGSGKTVFVFKLIENARYWIDPPPHKITYCYGEYQRTFARYPNVVFRRGLPDIEDFDGSRPKLLIIDGLMNELDESVANFFTKGSHHQNVSVVLLVHNLFHKNTHMKTITLNSHYLVLFKSPEDAAQVEHLFRQIYFTDWRCAVDAYKNATQEPYSYLLVDLRPEQNKELRLRANIFPGERHFRVRIEKMSARSKGYTE